MELKKTYWFLGSVYQRKKTDKFTVALYCSHKSLKGSTKRKFYRHVLEGDCIAGFEEVLVEARINYFHEAIPVTRGDQAFFCYTNKRNELFAGNRQQLEEKILPLLTLKKVSLQAKLTISSFLKLHGRTFDLIAVYEQRLKNKGFSFPLDVADFVQTREEEEHKLNTKVLVNKIYKRQGLLKKYDNHLYLSDIALLQNTKVHVDDFCVSIENMLDLTKNAHLPQLNELLDFSIRENRVELEASFKGSKTFLAYIVRAPFYIEQSKIERLLSGKIKMGDQTAIEIGVKVDERLGEAKTTSSINDAIGNLETKIESLNNDVELILNQFRENRNGK